MLLQKIVSTCFAFVIIIALGACTSAAEDASTGKPLGDLVKISVSPYKPVIAKNTELQLTAIGIFSDNSKLDLSDRVIWTSEPAETADFIRDSKIAAYQPGSTIVSADIAGIKSNTVEITVTDESLLSIEVSPLNPVRAAGSKVKFSALGLFTGGITQDITDSVTWTSSTLAVATFDNEDSASGVSANLAAGISEIQATFSGIDSNIVNLDVRDANLTKIDVRSNSNIIGINTHVAFSATGFYQDSLSAETFIAPLTNNVSWISDNSSIASFSNNFGRKGMLLGLTTGTTEISATWSGISSEAIPLAVHNKPLESVQVNSIPVELPLSVHQQFTATGTYTDQTQQDLSYDVVWLMRNGEIAFIDNAFQRSGLLSPTTTGTANLTASFRNATSPPVDVTTVDVKPVRIDLTPNTISLAKGINHQFKAIATLNDSTTVDVTKDSLWSTSNADNAAVSNTDGSKGLVTALTATTSATISANYSGLDSEPANINIIDASLVSIALTLVDVLDPINELDIPLGSSINIIARGTFSDSSTNDITDLVTWRAGDLEFATVSNALGSQGLVSTVKQGTTTIEASYDGKNTNLALTVSAPVLIGIKIAPSSANIINGQSKLFSISGQYTDRTDAVTLPVSWTSSNRDVATIVDGNAVSVGSGTTTITASVEVSPGTTLTAAASLNVDVAPTIDIVPASGTTIKIGDTFALSATGGRGPYTWEASNTNASIAADSGQLTAKTAGTVTVTARDADNYSGSVLLTIVPPVTVSSSNDATSMLVGETLQLTAAGGSGSFTWSVTGTSNTISANGLLSASAVETVTVTATDDNMFFGSLAITINPVPNVPPTADAGVDFTVTSNEIATLVGQGIDSDGSIVSYQWKQIGNPAVILETPASATTSFTAPSVSAPTNLTFELAVTDNDNATTTDIVVVNVNPIPTTLLSLQVISDTPTNSVTSGATVSFSALATYSDSTTPIDVTLDPTITWSLVATPMSLATATNNIATTDPAGGKTGTITMSASFGTITAVLTINVIAPTISIVAPLIGPVEGGPTVLYSANGGTPGYTWTVENGTTLANVDPISGSLMPLKSGGITLYATDANGFTSSIPVFIASSKFVSDVIDLVVDPALRQCIIDYTNFRFPTLAMAAPVTDIINTGSFCMGAALTTKITNLEGIQNFTHLNSLDLSINQITDLTPLQTLAKLSWLMVSTNVNTAGTATILSYAPLVNNKALRTLIADKNALSPAHKTEIARLTQLTRLDLNDNPIDDADMALFNNLVNLNYVSVDYTQISNISSLQSRSNLEVLHIRSRLTAPPALTGLGLLMFNPTPTTNTPTLSITGQSSISCADLDTFIANNPGVTVDVGISNPGTNCI